MSTVNRDRLFLASRIAMIATAMTFAVRGDVMATLGASLALDNQQLGTAAGAWAYGFTISILIGGQLVDVFGMRRVLGFAFLAHVAGIVLTILTTGFTTLFAATLIVGIGNGLIEAAVNPLAATLYPDSKTTHLNALHVWFPGGIVIGGLVAFALTRMLSGTTLAAYDWQIKTAVILVPVFIYGAMFLSQHFPATERVERGVSSRAMYAEALRPLFLLLLGAMVLTSSTELAPNQWIPDIMTKTAGLPGILVLVWINTIMAIGRSRAGHIVARISPVGVLFCSAVLSAIGLVLLSAATTAVTALAAATVFALGVCYFWPTMLGVTSERFPRGGALLLAIIGGVGTLSVAIFTGVLGGFYDAVGPAMAMRRMAALPAILIVVFGALWLRDRARGGYTVVSLSPDKLREPPVAVP